MDEAVLGQVQEFILTNFLFGDRSRMPEDSESLLGSGIVDSTGVLELVMFLEEDLGVPVSASETIPANLDSIANIAGFVTHKRG